MQKLNIQNILTISFKIKETGRFHCLVGKDGKPTADPRAPLQFKVRGDDGKLQIEIIDASGKACDTRSRLAIEHNKWYHAAATNDGKWMKLYLDSGDGYELQSEYAVNGALFNSVGTWTIGRGFYDDKIADDALAWIDEVRVSAKARTPDEFLFAR